MFDYSLEEIGRAVGGTLSGVDPCFRIARVSTDTRTIQPGDLFWALAGDNFDGHDFCEKALAGGGAAAVIESSKLPGIELPCIRVPDTLWALGELARYLRGHRNARVVGITGSVGKTSTKEILRAAIGRLVKTKATQGNNNNLVGLPKTLFESSPDDEWLLLEMGTDRPGEIQRLTEIAQPQVGVVTAIGEAHLDRLGSLEGVLAEKSDLLKGLPPNGTAVIPQDSRFREELVGSSNAPVVTFGTEHGSDYLAVDPKMRTRGCYGFLLETPTGHEMIQLQASGLHMVHAATAAAAVAVSSGFPLASVIEGLQSYTGLPGRCEILELGQGITVIADHYNANPVSMAAALRLLETFLERRRVFVAGEMWDLGRASTELHEMVGSTLGAGSLDLLVAVGPKTRHLVHGARSAGLPNRNIKWFETTDTAALEVPRMLEPSDVVLVKGSRGMKMEGVVDALTRHFGRKP
jgi:UDP-N-acetylmuramoyl-tripeptide--D-alanyl-D-alanine ligase